MTLIQYFIFILEQSSSKSMQDLINLFMRPEVVKAILIASMLISYLFFVTNDSKWHRLLSISLISIFFDIYTHRITCLLGAIHRKTIVENPGLSQSLQNKKSFYSQYSLLLNTDITNDLFYPSCIAYFGSYLSPDFNKVFEKLLDLGKILIFIRYILKIDTNIRKHEAKNGIFCTTDPFNLIYCYFGLFRSVINYRNYDENQQ